MTSGEALIDLGNISLEPKDERNWQEEANKIIDILRKRNIKINFDIDFFKPEDLQIEIDQKNHKFHFGTAVKSSRIADCYDAKEENVYCGCVRDNFNWLVDTQRYDNFHPMAVNFFIFFSSAFY